MDVCDVPEGNIESFRRSTECLICNKEFAVHEKFHAHYAKEHSDAGLAHYLFELAELTKVENLEMDERNHIGDEQQVPNDGEGPSERRAVQTLADQRHDDETEQCPTNENIPPTKDTEKTTSGDNDGDTESSNTEAVQPMMAQKREKQAENVRKKAIRRVRKNRTAQSENNGSSIIAIDDNDENTRPIIENQHEEPAQRPKRGREETEPDQHEEPPKKKAKGTFYRKSVMSEEQLNEMRNLYQQGKTPTEISKIMGGGGYPSAGTVYNQLRKQGCFVKSSKRRRKNQKPDSDSGSDEF